MVVMPAASAIPATRPARSRKRAVSRRGYGAERVMLFPEPSPAAKAYRFVARVTGRGLPAVDKALRLRCTLSAADHTVVGVSAVVLNLGSGRLRSRRGARPRACRAATPRRRGTSS